MPSKGCETYSDSTSIELRVTDGLHWSRHVERDQEPPRRRSPDSLEMVSWCSWWNQAHSFDRASVFSVAGDE